MASFHNFLSSATGGCKNLSKRRILPVRLFVWRLHCPGNGFVAGKARNSTKGSRATRWLAQVYVLTHIAPQTTSRLRRHEKTGDGVYMRLRNTVCPTVADRGRVDGSVIKLLFWTFVRGIYIFLLFLSVWRIHHRRSQFLTPVVSTVMSSNRLSALSLVFRQVHCSP